jgi:hypothetical protein
VSGSSGGTSSSMCGAPPSACLSDPPAGAVTCGANQPCPHDCGDNFQFPAGYACSSVPGVGGVYCCNR